MDVAIIKNDSVPKPLQGRFPDYDKMIASWLSPLEPRITVYDMQSLEKPAFHHDLYVSSGSRRSIYEQEDWILHYRDLTRELHEKRRPHFGICFGHQMIALALGAKVGKASGWGIGIHRWEVTREIILPSKKDLSLCVSHQDQVLDLIPEMDPFLSNEFCPIAGYTVGRHIMTVQGHPEFHPTYVEALMEIRRSLYPPKVYEDGKASLSRTTEEGDLIPAIRDFFFGD